MARATSDISGWPTSTDVTQEATAFGITEKLNQDLLQDIGGEPQLVGDYKAGSYAGSRTTQDPTGPGISGFIFEASGGDVGIDNAKEATFSYDVNFPSGYDFVEGGKMPGFCEYYFCSMPLFQLLTDV